MTVNERDLEVDNIYKLLRRAANAQGTSRAQQRLDELADNGCTNVKISFGLASCEWNGQTLTTSCWL